MQPNCHVPTYSSKLCKMFSKPGSGIQQNKIVEPVIEKRYKTPIRTKEDDESDHVLMPEEVHSLAVNIHLLLGMTCFLCGILTSLIQGQMTDGCRYFFQTMCLLHSAQPIATAAYFVLFAVLGLLHKRTGKTLSEESNKVVRCFHQHFNYQYLVLCCLTLVASAVLFFATIVWAITMPAAFSSATYPTAASIKGIYELVVICQVILICASLAEFVVSLTDFYFFAMWKELPVPCFSWQTAVQPVEEATP